MQEILKATSLRILILIGLLYSICSILISGQAHAKTTISLVGKDKKQATNSQPIASTKEASTKEVSTKEISIKELDHKQKITFSPDHIEVVETIVLATQGENKQEGIYSFELPQGAALYHYHIGERAQKSTFGIVDANASVRIIQQTSNQSTPDQGLLRMLGQKGSAQDDFVHYQMRIYPLVQKHSTTITLHWTAPVLYTGGNYSVRIPNRGTSHSLARSNIEIKPSFILQHLFGGQDLLAKKTSKNKSYSFFYRGGQDLIIQGRGNDSTASAYAQVAIYPLTKDSGVAAIQVSAPLQRAHQKPSFKQILLVVDTSKSMGKAGLWAASQFVDSLLTKVPANTLVQTILFDRKARSLFDGLQSLSPDTQKKIVKSIHSAPQKNGSNLSAAIAHLHQSIAKQKNSDPKQKATLIVFIGDGVLSQAYTAKNVLQDFGPGLIQESQVLSVILTPPHAPLPDSQKHVLSKLAYQSKGLVLNLHHSEASKKGREIEKAWGQTSSIRNIEVVLDKGRWVGGNFPEELPPGFRGMVLAYYQGGQPKNIEIRAQQAGKDIRLRAKKFGKKLTRRFAQMTLANSYSDTFPGSDKHKENRRLFVQAADKLDLITKVSAGIAIAHGDRFGAERLAMARRWGLQYYRRMPTPYQEAFPDTAFEDELLLSGHIVKNKKTLIHQKTGSLDLDIMTRRIRSHAGPSIQNCFNRLLRKDHGLRGRLELNIEVSRGEMHHVGVTQISYVLRPIQKCIVDAVYKTSIPPVQLGQGPEKIYKISYPIRFRLGKSKDKYINTDDPLYGIP